MTTPLIQVPVIKGEGSKQIFIDKTITLAGNADMPFAWKIHSVDFKVDIDSKDLKVLPGKPGKVILNGCLKKNIVYKVLAGKDANGVAYGPMHHVTVEYIFGDFIDLNKYCEDIKASDIAEVLEAFVEGFNEELEDPQTGGAETVYKKIHEKIVIKIKLKVTRTEHLQVEVDNGKKCEGY